MIFLGANDAVLPNSGQNVPLNRYCANLENIIQHPAVRAHATSMNRNKPAIKIILVTPPPIDEHQLGDNPLLNVRTAERTKSYADSCRRVGEGMDVAVVDLWSIMMKKAGWKGNAGEVLVGSRKRERSEVLGEMLLDGKTIDSRKLFTNLNLEILIALGFRAPLQTTSIQSPL